VFNKIRIKESERVIFSIAIGIIVGLFTPSKNPYGCGYMTTLFLIFIAPVLPSMVTMFFVKHEQTTKPPKIKQRASRPRMFLGPPPGHRLLANEIHPPHDYNISSKYFSRLSGLQDEMKFTLQRIPTSLYDEPTLSETAWITPTKS
jgi:hypothetical protein